MATTGDSCTRAALRARVVDATTELARLRCSDHAARDAILALRLTEHTLSGWWLTALDAGSNP